MTRQRRPPTIPAATRRRPAGNVPAEPGTTSETTGASHAARPSGAARPFDLAAPASPGLLDAILEVVGAETLTLHATLALWQREQDRLTNRAWRRPGGFARPGGV